MTRLFKAGKLAVLLLAMTVLMTGCGRDKDIPSDSHSEPSSVAAESEESTAEEAESKPASVEEKPIELTKQIDGRDGHMRVMVPAAWQDMTGQMDENGDTDKNFALSAGCPEEAAFMLGNAEAKDQVEVENASMYHQALVNAIAGSTSFENAQIESAVEITTVKGGLHGYKSRFTATYEGQSILYVVYTLEDGSNYYRLSFWTSASNAATEEPIFSAIADQFSLI